MPVVPNAFDGNKERMFTNRIATIDAQVFNGGIRIALNKSGVGDAFYFMECVLHK